MEANANCALANAVKVKVLACTVQRTPDRVQGHVEDVRSQSWASATFEGHRHAFTVRLDGAAACVEASALRLCGMLLNDEITLRGHILADLAITGEDTVAQGSTQARRLYFEALTVYD